MKEKRNIIYLKKPVLIKEENGIEKEICKIEDDEEKAAYEDYVCEEPEDSDRYPKYVSHGYLKTNNFLMKWIKKLLLFLVYPY